jgi:ectoine hydroxylase-related dioxygenase (phytanoyl-CoA dioxygenase family)
VAALDRDGAARIDDVLSLETAQNVLAHVTRTLEEKRKALEAQDLRAEGSFGDVLMRENRYDMLLDLDPPVQAALQEALTAVAPTLAGALGPDAELFELAALIADPKAPRQPVHPDTPYREGEGAAIITTFCALQDIDAEMGPTDIVPRTHTAEAHERFNAKDDGGREKVALLREYGNHKGVLSIGDANLIDSRLIHAGGGNDSRKRRVLFYFSFRRKGKVTPSGSLAYALRREGYTLDQLQSLAA